MLPGTKIKPTKITVNQASDTHREDTRSVDGAHISKSHRLVQPGAKNIHRHSPQITKILMRRVVKKPGRSLKRQLRAYGSTDYQAYKPSLEALTSVANFSLSEPMHLKAHIKKSSLISHFSSITSDHSAKADISLDTPAVKTKHEVAIRQAAAAIHTPAPNIHKAKSKTSADILDRALHYATSHQQPPHKLAKGKRRRQAKLWTASATVVLIIGFGISQNMTSIRLQLASAKVGFTASLPRTMPSGFSLSELTYSRGVVLTKFHSNSSNQFFAIIQRTSSINSQSLVQDYVAANYGNISVQSNGGLTVYLYGNHDASWVNNGIWYAVQSNGSLSDHQLLEMATSS